MHWTGLALSLACSPPLDDVFLDGAPASDSDSAVDTGGGDTSGSLQGRMIDADGVGAAGLQMRLCNDSCYMAETDGDGAFSFGYLSEGSYTLQAVDAANTDRATPHAILFVELGARTLPDWRIPEFAATTELTAPATVGLDQGLTVVADAAALSSGPYAVSDVAAVRSVWVEPAASGLPRDGLDGEIAALWYLGTYDLQVSPPWPLGGTIALPAGTYGVWTADNATKSWLRGGAVTVDAEGAVGLKSGGLERLTTLVLIEEKKGAK